MPKNSSRRAFTKRRSMGMVTEVTKEIFTEPNGQPNSMIERCNKIWGVKVQLANGSRGDG